jgi:serpin B
MNQKKLENTEEPTKENDLSKEYDRHINDIYIKEYDNHTIDTIKLLNTKEKEELLLVIKKANLASDKLNGLNDLSYKKIENYELSDKEKSNNDYYIKQELDNVLDNYETYSIKNEIKNYTELYTNNISIKKDFKNNTENYNLKITELDNDAVNDTKTINDNIKAATTENITRAVEEHDIKEKELIMINSLYFNYKWEESFDKNKVSETEFYTFENEIKTIEMMYGINTSYYENQYAKAFSKPFDNEKYSFIGILPNEKEDFNLSSLDINNLLLSKKEEKVLIGLPKINYQSEINLKELFSNYKINEVFDNNPNLTKMTEEQTKFSKVTQKVKISFGEKGTISTTIPKNNNEVYSKEEYTKSVILNRPFAFVIINNETNEILLIGKVITPNENN